MSAQDKTDYERIWLEPPSEGDDRHWSSVNGWADDAFGGSTPTEYVRADLVDDALKVLAAYAVLGAGRCTVSKKHAEMAYAAIAKAKGSAP